MSDCQHTLPLRDKVFAAKGSGRRCTECGAHVLVRAYWSGAILAATLPLFAVFIAMAWVDGGFQWFWLAAFIAAHIAVYLIELEFQTPIEYDIEEYRRVSKVRRRRIAVATMFAVGIGVFFWLK